MNSIINHPVHDFQPKSASNSLDMHELIQQSDRKIYTVPANNYPPMTFEEAQSVLSGPGCSSTNRLETLLDLLPRLPDDNEKKLRLFKDVWAASDNIWDVAPTAAFPLFEISQDAHFTRVLDQAELSWIKGLGDRFTVYRGCSSERIPGFSWTTSKEVALGFARGHRGLKAPDPVLVKAQCDVLDVMLATNERNEFVIVVNPELFEEVVVTPLTQSQSA